MAAACLRKRRQAVLYVVKGTQGNQEPRYGLTRFSRWSWWMHLKRPGGRAGFRSLRQGGDRPGSYVLAHLSPKQGSCPRSKGRIEAAQVWGKPCSGCHLGQNCGLARTVVSPCPLLWAWLRTAKGVTLPHYLRFGPLHCPHCLL